MTLAFLAIVVVIAAVGVGAISLRSRQPTSIDSGIQSFRREMNALAPHRPTAAPTSHDHRSAHDAPADIGTVDPTSADSGLDPVADESSS